MLVDESSRRDATRAAKTTRSVGVGSDGESAVMEWAWRLPDSDLAHDADRERKILDIALAACSHLGFPSKPAR